AEPQAKVSTAVIPAALSAATRGPLVHRDICIPPVTSQPSMHSGDTGFWLAASIQQAPQPGLGR
ncbi:MAG: hypothetical protein WAN71_02930, partial [Mycobacterium sp.]|uniref:hypothetical protein n=1 Tax=Mycobacterium sp. TaxID=1785 RepID=UPI003BAF19A9